MASGCTELIICCVVWLSAAVLSAMVFLLRLIDVVVDARQGHIAALLRVQDEPASRRARGVVAPVWAAWSLLCYLTAVGRSRWCHGSISLKK
jgi:hypothetical protein